MCVLCLCKRASLYIINHTSGQCVCVDRPESDHFEMCVPEATLILAIYSHSLHWWISVTCLFVISVLERARH
jgi:hypothetical protein